VTKAIEILNKITDKILAYRPKSKGKKVRKEIRKKSKIKKRS
jgi:hypothetical protein